MSWYRTRLTLSALAVGGLLLLGTSPTTAEEWEESSQRYEDDSWYDITEWFDGNDYNPTDERVGTWDDESYSSDTYSDDSDNDYDYDYESNDYGYYYDGSGNDSWYGYDSRYGDDNWFYDYWDDGYAFYRDWDGDGIYDYSTSYYDLDGDGFYDARLTSQDYDNDGIYDDSNFHVFAASSGSQENESSSNKQSSSSNQMKEAQQGQRDSQRKMVTGKIAKTKKTSVRDTKHLVVQLNKQDGQKCMVDLGPASKLQDLDLQEGDTISVQGPITKVGDHRVLIAQKVKLDGDQQQSKQIQRNQREFQGEIADTRTAQVRGKKHQLAILSNGSTKKRLVDLGPADQLDVTLSKGDKVKITGVMAKVNDRKLLIAHDLHVDGERYQIDHARESDAQQSSVNWNNKDESRQADERDQQNAQREITGEVVSTRKIRVRGKQRQAAMLKNEDGRRMLVDLGPAQEYDAKIKKGDRLTVRGPIVKAGDQMVVLARQLKHEGQETTLRRGGVRHSDANQRSVRGEVTSTRKGKIRGQQRQLLNVETQDGNQLMVDLGSPQDLETEFEQGDEIIARGALVKAGNKVVLIAYEVETENEGTQAINRKNSNQPRN